MLDQIAAQRIADVPTRTPVIVAPGTRLGDVVTSMRNGRTGAALVVDRQDLVGIFTERDLLQRVDHRTLAWRDQPVSKVMTGRPMVIRPEDTIAEALRRLEHGRCRHLPVVERRAPVAIVTVRDLLAFIASKFPAEFINLPPSPDREARGPWGG